jgi:polar amino acid transport system substrate-binding protein
MKTSSFKKVSRALALGIAACLLPNLTFPLTCFVAKSHQIPVRTIRIASEGARPPYNYLENNKLAGFEIDLAQELCMRMKVACIFVTQNWDGLIPGLLADQYDAIMAAMEITDESRQKIDFSKPYIRMPSAIVTSVEHATLDPTPDGLVGKKIGVEAGGTHQAYAEAVYKHSEIVPYASLEEAFLDLAEGRVDLVIGDKDAVEGFMKTRREGRCCIIAADVPRDPVYFGDGIGIGLRKDDSSLKAMFEKALDSSMADGAFARIRAKYFDFKIN